MTFKPTFKDIRIVLSFCGNVLIAIGFLNFIPLLVSLAWGEWSAALDFAIGAGAGLALGLSLASLKAKDRKPLWVHGMAAAALSWLMAMALAAIPYWLSGTYASFLDAMFDTMSGFTTTGLSLNLDLDHASLGLNTWRHLVTFVGGQGVIVLALAFLVSKPAGGYQLYVGEGKDERLLPSVMHTSKAIWRISLVYLALGTFVLFCAGLSMGLKADRAFLHASWMFMSSWSTGGFAPMSQNILYYHSAVYEALTMVFFLIGSFNFALHYAVWTGNRKELRRNLELSSFLITLSISTVAGCFFLFRGAVYPEAVSLVRKGFYLIASGHTTTGLMNVYARQFVLEWGDAALVVMIAVMLIGGSACSTAGGFKGLRMGLIWKGITRETRRLLASNSAVIEQSYLYHGRKLLDDGQLRSASLIVILYCASFALASLAGVAAGYPALDAAFEAASVSGNVGFSIGVTSPTMPDALKIVYIIVMWAGRLEFMAVLTLAGFIKALFRGIK